MARNKKVKVTETVFKPYKGYKGQIKWAKLIIGVSIFKVEKRRPFGWESYGITENEYNWIDTPKKAEKMWDFIHYYGTATWFGGELKHPITGEAYTNQNERPKA